MYVFFYSGHLSMCRALTLSVESQWFEPQWVKSKTEQIIPTCISSLVSVHHLRPRAGLVGPVSV